METERGKDWLQELKAGDWVFVTGTNVFECKQVERVTPNYIVVKLHKQERKYSKADGSNKVGMFNFLYLKEDTPKNREILHRKRLMLTVRSKLCDLHNIPLESIGTTNLELLLVGIEKHLEFCKAVVEPTNKNT